MGVFVLNKEDVISEGFEFCPGRAKCFLLIPFSLSTLSFSTVSGVSWAVNFVYLF